MYAGRWAKEGPFIINEKTYNTTMIDFMGR